MNKESSNSATNDQRVIRVFVSSTFRDMQAERDELVKRAFPQLRKLCDERNVVWSEVDLRWGITQEQSERGEVLPICLAEIKRCRPFFIGLLGERYGWIPDEIAPELIDREKWLEQHLHHSVTELEILHGVLNDPKMNDHALFYFRDAAYLNSLSDQERAEFLEIATGDEIAKYGQSEAENRAAERRQKLVSLKEKIREHCEQNKMPAPRTFPNPQELGEMVLRDMAEIIERLYPKDEIPEPLDRDALEHEAFAQSRKKVYIGRQDYFDRLDEHAQSDAQPLVILGESGSGKSALLSNWALQYRQTHPEDLLITHFIGATPYSADWAAMLRRIMGELKRQFDIQQEIPDKPDELRPAFTNFLHMAAAKGRCILIFDALNQLEDRDGAPDLVWLPPFIPPNVRMILSTLPGRALDNLTERGLPTLQIEPLSIEERQRLIPEYLAQYSKKLDEKRAAHIAHAEQTANPLFLRALLDELRVFGIHEKLDERIAHYLEAQTVDKLYEKILARYEEDYERERPALVKDAMSLIWASRRGLSEAELLDLLGTNDEPLPRAYWSPLYLAAESLLVNKSGLIGFSHDYFRLAVRNYYLKTYDQEYSFHNRLAKFFTNRSISLRKLDEQPWQQMKAGNHLELMETLIDLELLQQAWKHNYKYEWVKYWNSLTGIYNLGECYEKSISDVIFREGENQHSTDILGLISRFLNLMGLYESALPFAKKNLEIVQRIYGDGHYKVASSLNNLGTLYLDSGKYSEAVSYLKRAIEILERHPEQDRPILAVCLNNLASIYNRIGNHAEQQGIAKTNIARVQQGQPYYETALQLYRRSLVIFEQLKDMEEETQSCRGGYGQLLSDMRDYDGAELVLRQMVTTREQTMGRKHPETAIAYNNLALLLTNQRKLNEAEKFFKQSLEIQEMVLGAAHHATILCLNNLALLFQIKGSENIAGGYRKSTSLWREALRRAKQTLGNEHPHTELIRKHLRSNYRDIVIHVAIALLFLSGGIGLGRWNAWLWLLGVPMIMVGAYLLYLEFKVWVYS